MCNPRRVRVTATEQFVQAWENEVTRVVTVTADAMGEARLREPIDTAVGAPTLLMLERILAEADGWEQDGESFRHALDGGYIAYHPETREIEIVAQQFDQVSAQGQASRMTQGTIAEDLEVTGVGTYYDDGWGGLTEQTAQSEAEVNAQQMLLARRQEVLGAAQEAEAARLAAALDATAAEAAGETLEHVREQRSAALRADAQRRLIALGIQGRNVFHRALADAYREAILAYARSRGAEGVVHSERDGVLEIEFELRG